MSRILWLALVGGALVACGDGPKVPVEDFVITECLNKDGAEPPIEDLLLTGSQDSITVAHRAHPLNCNNDIHVDARVDDEAGVITVTYDDRSKDPVDCECVYDLGYVLGPVERGEWVVTVPGPNQATVKVDP